MKTRILFITVLAAALAVGAWWQFSRAPKTAPPPGSTAPAAATASGPAAGAAPAVLEFAAGDLITLAPGSITRSIPITGSLRAVRQGLVRAKAAGELRELLVREGESVSAGQTIARVDPTEFESRVKEREAQLRSAQAQLEQAESTLARNRQLIDRGFISPSALDNASSALDAAAGARDAAQAQLAVARKALADTAVLAPMSGVVAERFVQPGEKVSPDVRILSLIDLSQLEIEAPVPASELGAVRIGQAVSLQVEGVAGEQSGRILRIGPSTSTGTRSVPVYIGIDNRGDRLRAGLFAQGSLALETRQGVITVPLSALRERAGRSFVYAVQDGRLVEKDVVPGLRDESARDARGGAGAIEVRSGLAAGDRIVAVNLGTLRAGSPVRELPAR
ncbi:MAG: efflux RND transporter periplasmic adaptor subunit [Betaproteobacteria bacterium]|nr:efflux RND transporter periplasmic adaptor subunit [Betaproteobacteria bacterium]